MNKSTKYQKYLNDAAFLKQLTELHIKDYFVKIAVLDWKENFIENIEGKVISASINIDGNSIIRRTATLSVLIDETNNNITNVKNILSINKKINLQIGFINSTDKYLDEPIIWFPLGVYVITDNSISYSSTGLVASLQLKDKMCLLNGDCGGTFPASVIFDTYTTVDENGHEVIERPTIYQIIQELVNHFGGEQLGKIIISDLDNRVKQVMKWTGSSPLYVAKFSQDQYFYTTDSSNPNIVKNNQKFPKQTFEYGEDVGYIYTDFTYPGELIGDAGNTITDILEQIKNVLGNFEYFYDLNGNFVFRQKKNYLNNAQSKYILDNIRVEENNRTILPDYINSLGQNNVLSAYLIEINNGTSAYEFNNSNLISSYSNTPKYSEIKNDFVVWGIRKSTQGIEIPLRYHLAIDKKPQINNSYYVFEYQDETDGLKKWYRPIFLETNGDRPAKGSAGVFYCVGASEKKIKEKQSKIASFPIYKWGDNGYEKIDSHLEKITTKDWRTQLLMQGLEGNVLGTESNYYFAELFNEWPQIYDVRAGKFFKETLNNPTQINYFLDFIDAPASPIAELDVNNIGRRTKVFNEESNVNCVFQAWIPDLILINTDDEDKGILTEQCVARGQPYYQVGPEIYDSLETGGFRYSAYEEIRQVIHQYTKYNESISLQTIPIYYLEPNTRITVNNTESNIYGDYMIESLSFTLDNSSMLTINATRVPDKI